MKHEYLERAKQQILHDGYVVLEGLVPEDCLDILRNKMDEDTEELVRRGAIGGYGSAKGHLQQNPPPFKPYVFDEIIANKVVSKITTSILGNSIINNFYSANTNCPNSEAQVVHCDFGHLWKECPGHPPVNLVINLVLQDVNENNGSTEIWPGSHLDFSFICEFMDIPKNKTVEIAALAARRNIVPPIRLNVKKEV